MRGRYHLRLLEVVALGVVRLTAMEGWVKADVDEDSGDLAVVLGGNC